MKHKLVLILSLIVILGLSVPTLSFAEKPAKANPQNETVEEEIEDEDEVEDENEGEEEETNLQNKGVSQANTVQVRNSIRKLEQLQEKIEDPEIGEEIEETTQNQERSQEKIEEKLEEMDARPGFLKFILGPDYKNAGEVRSEIVRLQNQERQMTKIRERLDDPEDVSIIDEAINEVQTSIDSIKQELDEKLSGFSLFGWLTKFLSGYVAPIPSPTPTIESSPESSPSPSIVPTETPEPTTAPTTEPSVPPEV